MPLPDAVAHCYRFVDRWRSGAMFPSEIAWFLDWFQSAKCNLLIECGRENGVSTEAFARYFDGTDVTIVSIDFDDNPDRALRARQRVASGAELLSGDIHKEVPKILRRYPNRRIAVLQDAAKGWEGLATLLAAAVQPNVGVVAQHNLHLGHITRTVFQFLSLRPSFPEVSQEHLRYAPLIDAERRTISPRNPNRPLDHTSLGVMSTDAEQQELIRESFALLKSLYGPWNPGRVVSAWERDDFDYVSRVCRRSRYTPARFKPR